MGNKLNNFLRKIKKDINISNIADKELFPSGSSPCILYGLLKIHKPDFSSKFQFRPIFAAFCTPFYKVAKFMVSLLSELPENEYSVKNLSSFVSDLLSHNFQADNLYTTSYDVENLYTNVPLRETINIM